MTVEFLNRMTRLLVCFALAGPVAALAQEPPPNEDASSSDAAAPEGENSEPAPAEDAPTLMKLEGDVIHFKFGAPMTGVQVLRSTPQFYFVETAPGVDPLQIQRRLIDRIEYDEVDPNLQRRLREQQQSNQENVVAAEQLTPDLHAKLTAPIGERLPPFQNRDIVDVLEEVARTFEIALELDESLRELPEASRRWSVATTADTTVMSLLQEHLRQALPTLRIDFQFDKVVLYIPAPEGDDPTVSKPSAQNEQPAQSEPSAQSQPPARAQQGS